MIAGAVLQAAAFGQPQLIVGRIVSGLGMGIINSTVPVLQAEFSPKASRGICKSCTSDLMQRGSLSNKTEIKSSVPNSQL